MEIKLAQRLVLHYYKTKLNTISKLSPQKAARSAFKLFCTPPSKAHRKTETPLVFQKGEKISMRVDGIILNGFRFQSLHPNRKTVLICHGFQSNCFKFEKYVRMLIKEGFVVLAFDAPAHGLSKGKTINASLYSKMILQIENEFGPLHAIIAHSLGALAASLAFEVMNDKEKKLVLIAPATETTTAITNFFKFVAANTKVRRAFEKYIYRIAGHPSSWYSITRAIQNFSSKTLWLHDEHDDACPYKDTEAIRKMELPHVEFITTKNLGHSKIYRDSHVQKTVIDFLKVN